MMQSSKTVWIGLILACSTVACSKTVSPPTAAASAYPAASKSSSQVSDKVLSTGTKFAVTLPTEISTSKDHDQDHLTMPVHSSLFGSNPALKGAKVEGHLEDVVKAARGKKASLHLMFDDIVLADGTAQPIDAALVETHLETKTQGKFLKNAGVILGGAAAGHFLGNKIGKRHGGLAGATAATAFVLSSPGGEVVLKKGTELDLKLESPLDVSS